MLRRRRAAAVHAGARNARRTDRCAPTGSSGCAASRTLKPGTALEPFYGGPVWAAHAAAANDTLHAWDDALLLKPVRPETAFDLVRMRGRPLESIPRRCSPEFTGFVTETASNTFARLPVREGERVLAWFGTVDERAHPPGSLERLDLPAALGDLPPARA